MSTHTPSASRANLFAQLATLERAAIPTLEALRSVARDRNSPLTVPLQRLIQALEQGETLAEAGRRVKLWQPWEVPVVAAGEVGGRLLESFQRLAEHYQRQDRRWRRLRGRLLLPALTLLIGVLVGPLPALVAGNIGVPGYLLRVLLPLLVLGGLLTLLRQAYQGLLTGSDNPLTQLLARLPIVHQLRQRELITALSLLLDSDLSPDRAFTVLADSSPDRRTGKRLGRAASSVAGGMSFTDSLTRVGLLDDPVGQQLLVSGEQAGRLPEMLRRYRDRLDESLDSSLDGITGVLPWIIYAGVVAWVFL